MRFTFLVMLFAAMFLTLTGCSGGSSTTPNPPVGDETIAGTDRYYVRFNFDLDGNSTADFEDELAKRGLSANKDQIIQDMLKTLRMRYEYTSSGTVIGVMKISFSSGTPYGSTVSGSWGFCANSNQYNVYVLVNVGGSGSVGMNYMDDPTINPPPSGHNEYNERIENIAHPNATSIPLGSYIDRIGNAVAGVGFTTDLFVRVFASVTAHEMGHGLGLSHNSVSNNFIMDPATLINNPATDFTAANKNILQNNSLPGRNR